MNDANYMNLKNEIKKTKKKTNIIIIFTDSAIFNNDVEIEGFLVQSCS